MGTFNAFYVRASGQDPAPVIRENFPEAKFDRSAGFIGVKMPDDAFDPPKAALAGLSRRLVADVIWLSFQSVVDAFRFQHWLGGSLVRALVFGCYQDERTWEEVGGEPEPWEKEVFFSKIDLARAVKWLNDPAEQREIERVWESGEIAAGATIPNLDSRDCAHRIAAHYGLPHYGL